MNSFLEKRDLTIVNFDSVECSLFNLHLNVNSYKSEQIEFYGYFIEQRNLFSRFVETCTA